MLSLQRRLFMTLDIHSLILLYFLLCHPPQKRSLPINTAVISMGDPKQCTHLTKNQPASQPVTRVVMTLLLSSSVYTEFGKKRDGPSKKKTHIILYLRVPKAKAKVHVLMCQAFFPLLYLR